MWRQLTVQRLTVAILFILLFAMAVRTPIDTDTWWHLRSGQYQLENRTVIDTGLFSFTQVDTPWINHSWGAQIIMYGVYAAFGGHGVPGDGGNVGLALLTAVLATGGLIFVYKASPGSVYVRAFALVLGAAAAAVFWSPRPQMFTFFFSCVVYYLLMLYKRHGKDRLWLIPLIVLVWGNLHAGFATAFILMAGVVIGETVGNVFSPKRADRIGWRGIGRLLLIMVVAALALVINPFGLEMLKVPFQTVNIGVLQDFIQEWASPNFHERQTWPFLFLLLGSLGLAALSREPIDWSDLALLIGTGFLSFLAGRNIALFAVVATPVLARYGEAFLAERGWTLRPMTTVQPGMARLNWLVLILIALVGVGKIIYAVNPFTVSEAQIKYLPVQVADYIETEHPQGNMFNSYNWGGYLMFAAPDVPVFVDGRTDLYGDDFLAQYLRTVFLQGDWRAVLDEYDIGFVVIEADGVMAAVLRDEPGWHLAYEDDQAVLFEREEA